ncbi:MAG: DMT family transporter [Sediminibacterium sp.]|nr:DMT family transporter [Sediminibacterium sp.]
MGYLIAILTTLCWSIGIFPFTEAAKRFGTAALNQYRLLLAWVFITIIVCVYCGTNPLEMATRPSSRNYLYLGLSGIIGFTIGDFFSFSSFKILGPKLGSLYTTIAPFAALLMSIFLLNEHINWIGVSGMLITIGGVVWLTLSKSDKKEAERKGFRRDPRGMLYGVLGALCQGCGLVLSKLALQNTHGETNDLPTLHAVWIRLLFASVAAAVFALASGTFKTNTRIIFTNQNGGLKYMIAGTIFGPVIGVSCSLLAILYLQVAEAQTIFALLPIFVLPLNYFFYKERITKTSLLACFTAITGVIILIWRNQWI